MQGQRPSGNPPLRLHAKPSASNICACVIAFRVKYVRVRTVTHVGNRTFNVRAPMATGGQIPWQRPVFYRFLVNNSNFFVTFMPMFPKNMSPINI